MSLILMVRVNDIVTLTLNRPEKLNALSPALFETLNARMDQLEAERPPVKCVILRAAGRAFCAGADMKALKEGHSFPDPDYRSKTIERFASMAMPVVVSIHGHCYTGGLELALAGDVIVCAENATFCDTHAQLGIRPRWGMSARLTRRVGTSFAKLFSMTCAPISGREAHRVGLSDACVAEDQLSKATNEIARQIAHHSLGSLVAIKHLYDSATDMPLRHALIHERDYTS